MDSLQPPSKACHSFSAGTTPTVYRALPTLEHIREAWLQLAKKTEHEDIKEAIDFGLKNIDKWYRKLDDTDIYFICLGKLKVFVVLDVIFGLISCNLQLLIHDLSLHIRKSHGQQSSFNAGKLNLRM